MNFLKKYGKNIAVFGLFALVALFGMVGVASAQVDNTLQTAIASSTSYFTDNLGAMITFVFSIILKLAGVALGIGALYFIWRKLNTLWRKA